jgi:hypothetical protein
MKTVIFAPHIDDETIGCHSLLAKGEVTEVYYFFEYFEERVLEALKAAERFGFATRCVLDLVRFESSFHSLFAPDDVILVPRIEDHHPDHQTVHRMAKSHHSNLLFYSVDMNSGAIPYTENEVKKNDLYRLYPSQKDYFDNHPQCYLFEHISKSGGQNG